MYQTSDENIISVEFPKVFQALEKFLKPNNRGFELAYNGAVPNSHPSIFYQSNQCKFRIQCTRDARDPEIEIYISYGRLHAPLDKDIIEWKNEKCYCWHSLSGSPLLYFLDGQSPAEANSLEYITPRILKEFLELIKGKGWTVPEYSARKHAFIWERYDQRLFDLFDLRYPDLWDEYVNFLKKYDYIRNERSKMKVIGIDNSPVIYKIC
jgi:hypothetical protein